MQKERAGQMWVPLMQSLIRPIVREKPRLTFLIMGMHIRTSPEPKILKVSPLQHLLEMRPEKESLFSSAYIQNLMYGRIN